MAWLPTVAGVLACRSAVAAWRAQCSAGADGSAVLVLVGALMMRALLNAGADETLPLSCSGVGPVWQVCAHADRWRCQARRRQQCNCVRERWVAELERKSAWREVQRRRLCACCEARAREALKVRRWRHLRGRYTSRDACGCRPDRKVGARRPLGGKEKVGRGGDAGGLMPVDEVTCGGVRRRALGQKDASAQGKALVTVVADGTMRGNVSRSWCCDAVAVASARYCALRGREWRRETEPAMRGDAAIS